MDLRSYYVCLPLAYAVTTMLLLALALVQALSWNVSITLDRDMIKEYRNLIKQQYSTQFLSSVGFLFSLRYSAQPFSLLYEYLSFGLRIQHHDSYTEVATRRQAW